MYRSKIFSTLMLAALSVFLIAAMSSTAWGQTTFYDGFANGDLSGNIGGTGAVGSTGNGWTTHSGTLGTITSTSTSLSYTGLAASTGFSVFVPGANATNSRDVNTPISMGSATVAYFSALVNIVDNTQLSTTADYFMHFGATAGSAVTIFGGRLGIVKNVAGTAFRFAIENTSGGTPSFTDNGSDLSFGTTYLVVVKYDRAASPTVATMWVNPSLGGSEPGGGITNSTGTGTFATFGSICIREGSGTPKAYYDEVRVATTWADVTAVPPSAPTAITGAASAVAVTTATLNGTVTANGASTTVDFDYGTTIGYGTNVGGTPSPVSGYSGTAVSAAISSLTPNQLYHFRVNGTNSFGGPINGSDATFTTPPDAPTATAASSTGETGFTANWTAGAGNTPANYELQVATDVGFTSQVAGSPFTGSWVTTLPVTGLSGGVTYHYRVRGNDAGGNGGWSNTIDVLTIPAAPLASAPTGVGSTFFTANWGSVTGAADYRLDVSSDYAFGSFVSGYSDKTVAGTSDLVSPVLSNAKYYYRVRAVNATGTSGNSNIDSASTSSASVPSLDSPTATAIGETDATLGANLTSENNSATTERGVVWATTANPTTFDNKVIEGGTGTGVYTTSVSGMPSGTFIHYRGYAINGIGTGYTGDATFFTLSVSPTTHAGSFTATTASYSSIDLTWAAASGANGYIILQRTGADPTGTPDDATGYSVGNTIGDGTVAAIVTGLSATVTGLSPDVTYHYSIIPFAWDGSDAATYNYYTAPTIPTSNATTYSKSSDVIASPGFVYKTNIPYILYTSVLNIDTSNSVPAFGLTIRDGGGSPDADAVGTELTAISFDVTNVGMISRAALYDGGIELGEVAVTASPITFTGISASAPDGGTKDLVLYVAFNHTVTDKSQFSFTISSVTDPPGPLVGSGFAAANGGGAASSTSGNNNKVDVTADRLAFIPVANGLPSTNFTASAKAVDANDNTDIDFVNGVTFAKASGPGNLTGTTSPSAVLGIATTTDLQLDAGGTYTLSANAAGLTGATSNSFAIVSPAVFRAAAGADTLYWDDPASWVIESGGSATGTPQGQDQVLLDHTYHPGSYVMSTGPNSAQTPVMWDSARQITVGTIGDSDPGIVELLIPHNGPTSPTGSAQNNLKFGDGVAGNYDFIIQGNGQVSDDKNSFARSCSYRTLSDSLWIRTGGRWYHNTKGFNTMHRVLSRRMDGDYGTIEFDINGAVSGTFDISGGGNYYYPNVEISNTHGFSTYFWFGTGQTVIRGNLIIHSGAKDSMNLGPSAPFIVYGNVVNDGIMMAPASAGIASPLLMRGSSPQTISGSGTFDLGGGMVIMNPAGVTMSSNINVPLGTVQTSGNFSWDSTGGSVTVTYPATGVLNTGSSVLSLNPNGSLTEGNNPIVGNVTATRTIGTTLNTSGNIGFDITAASAPGVTTIDRKTGVPSNGNGHQSILRYFDVNPAVNSGLNATIGFSYGTSELNSIPEANLILEKSTDGGTTWSGKNGTINTGLHKITATGVNSFSRWTAADVNAPLFITHTITLRKISSLTGDINNPAGETYKKWRLSLYQDSVAGLPVNTGNPNNGILVSPNLEAGTYIGVEEDSSASAWIRLGKIHHGVRVAGTTGYDTITVSGGVSDSCDFINQKTANITVYKFKDTDGDPNTIESPKQWHLSLYSASVLPGNLVVEGDADQISAQNLQAGTYIAVEADSGAGWVRLNGNHTRFDTLTLFAAQSLADTFINFRPNSITVHKYEDQDGIFETVGDRVLKGWDLSVSGPGGPYSSNGGSTIVLNNIGDGKYIVTEADSAGWIHLGYNETGFAPHAGDDNSVSVTVADGANITLDLVNAPPIYSQPFRTFSSNALGMDVDQAGKLGKYVKRKAWRVDLAVKVKCDSNNINDFHVEFPSVVDTSFPFYTVPARPLSNPDGKLKKFDVTFTSPLNHGDSVIIYAHLKATKAIKSVKYWWTRNAVVVGKKLSGGIFITNEAKNPMPNRINALAEVFQQYYNLNPVPGLLVGKARTDSAKNYAWYQAAKYGDVLKTLNDKSNFQTGQAQGFNADLAGKIIKGRFKSLSPKKYSNKLLAEMIMLHLNIDASAAGKTPPGFGELVFETDSFPQPYLSGQSLKAIAKYTDSLMMGYLVDSIAGTKTLKVRKFYGTAGQYDTLYRAIFSINNSFEGALDTIDFATKLHFKGVKPLIQVPFLHGDPGAVIAKIATADRPFIETPPAYSLYQNYPNPFNPTTTIQFDLPLQSVVTLKVYNMLGQEVATLLDREQMDEGTQQVAFNASNYATGVYFYRIVSESVVDPEDGGAPQQFVSVKKMLLIK